MQLRINPIAFVLAAALISGGCVGQHALETDGSEIDFGAVAVQLEAGTKSEKVFLRQSDFVDGDLIAVSAWHDSEGERVFNNQIVQDVDQEHRIWRYDPRKKWRWGGGADFYDFLAVAEPELDPDDAQASASDKRLDSGDSAYDEGLYKLYQGLFLHSGSYPFPDYLSPVSAKTGSDPFTLTVTYDASFIQYDLLLAGTRRRISDPNPSAKVPLNFRHALCAVKVKIIKHLGSSSFYVNSFQFKNVMYRADIQASMTQKPGGEWAMEMAVKNPLYNNLEPLFGSTKKSHFIVDADDYYPKGNDEFYDLLLPQTLKEDARLSISYESGGYIYNWEESLQKIYDEETETPVTQWEPGYKYEYDIHILVNGGVLAYVTTTPWEVINAHTPGLLLPTAP